MAIFDKVEYIDIEPSLTQGVHAGYSFHINSNCTNKHDLLNLYNHLTLCRSSLLIVSNIG